MAQYPSFLYSKMCLKIKCFFFFWHRAHTTTTYFITYNWMVILDITKTEINKVVVMWALDQIRPETCKNCPFSSKMAILAMFEGPPCNRNEHTRPILYRILKLKVYTLTQNSCHSRSISLSFHQNSFAICWTVLCIIITLQCVNSVLFR